MGSIGVACADPVTTVFDISTTPEMTSAFLLSHSSNDGELSKGVGPLERR